MSFLRPIARRSRDPLFVCVAAVLAAGAANVASAGLQDAAGMHRGPTATGMASSAPASTAAAVVTSCADDGGFDTLRHAVTTADPGDTIDLTALACSTITLQAGAIVVAVSDLTILGPGPDALTIDGNHAGRVFNHAGTGTLTLTGLTIANGTLAADKAEGGCIYAAGNLVLNRALVTSCTAVGQSLSAGGAILGKGDVDLESSTLSDSSADAQVGADGTIGGAGGGAFVFGTLTLTNSVISGNTVHAPTGKTAAGGVGASKVIAKYSTITGNAALAAGTPTSAGFGGAVYASQMLLRGCTIDHNLADIAAAIYVQNTSVSAYANILQSTISSNSSNLAFSGIITQAPLAIANSTIAFNTAGSYGGPAVGVPNGVTATLESTIIADNVPLDLDGGGTITGANNLVKVAGQNVTVPVGTFTLDPQLGPLQLNGGHTRTHALLPGSPAIGQGDDNAGFATDQRGPTYHRVVGAKADIGAYEVDPDHVFGDAFEPTPPLS